VAKVIKKKKKKNPVRAMAVEKERIWWHSKYGT
jgi:hypothetical protein